MSEHMNTMIDRAGMILDYLFKSPVPVGVSKLSKDLGLPKATVFRILVSLEKWRMVEKAYGSDDYGLGMALVMYGAKASERVDIVSVCRPHMDAFSERIQENVNLNIEYKGTALNLYKTSAAQSGLVAALIPVSPLNCSGAGKILLSGKSEAALRAYFDSDLPERRTAHSIMRYEAYLPVQERIKKHHIAYDDEEYEYGLFCVAVPITHGDRIIATLSVTGPKTRIHMKDLERIESGLLEMAQTLSKEIAPLSLAQLSIQPSNDF